MFTCMIASQHRRCWKSCTYCTVALTGEGKSHTHSNKGQTALRINISLSSVNRITVSDGYSNFLNFRFYIRFLGIDTDEDWYRYPILQILHLTV